MKTWGDIEKEWNSLRYEDYGCPYEKEIDIFIDIFDLVNDNLTITQLEYLNELFSYLYPLDKEQE
jgi:hypothetical protein